MSVNIIGHDCCSCKACVAVCKHNAINVFTDSKGFEQVKLDSNLCVECGLCEKVCPILSKPVLYSEHKNNYACYALNNDIKKKGSSGGLFGLFATHILKNNGVVYGAAFDKELRLRTTRITSLQDLPPLCKSKHLLCDTNEQFINIRKDLNDGRQVLICSTPCQISALRLYLRKEYTNLILIEFVCHGVGSQKMFDDSIKFIENRKDIKITSFTFREKYQTASSHYYSFNYFKKGKLKKESNLYLYFPYYNAYCKQLNCRSICYRCHYAQEARVADITIGDFHTVAKYFPDIDRFAGVSMVTCNNIKGVDFFNLFKSDLFLKQIEWDILKAENRFDNGSATNHEHPFMRAYEEGGINGVFDKYLKPSLDWKRLLYYNLPGFLRKILVKMM